MNVLYMATEHDSLYAFNADSGTQLWKTSLLGSGETTSDAHNCGQIIPEIGITSTPVIDRAKGTIFAVGMSKDTKRAYHQRLHTLSLTTGAESARQPGGDHRQLPRNRCGFGKRDGSLQSGPVCGACRTSAVEWDDLPVMDIALRLPALHGMGDGV